MTKKNITTVALTLALVMAVAGFALAGPGGQGGQGYYGRGTCGAWGGGPGNGGLRAVYGQLTPEKRAAVDKIFESYRGKFAEVRDAMVTKHALLEAMVNGGQADEKKIAGVVGEMTKLRDRMFTLRQGLRADLSKELGIELPAAGFGRGCPGYGAADGDGFGPGMGRGMGRGYGMGQPGYGVDVQ